MLTAVNVKFGNQVKAEAQMRRWSQNSELRQRTGFSQSKISRIMSGELQKISLQDADTIAAAFGVKLSALLASANL